MIDTDTPSPQPALPAALEATFAALHRDAVSARHRLHQPRAQARRRDTPALWDAGPIDSRPDDCWRCDAVQSADTLGLCPACRTDLCA